MSDASVDGRVVRDMLIERSAAGDFVQVSVADPFAFRPGAVVTVALRRQAPMGRAWTWITRRLGLSWPIDTVYERRMVVVRVESSGRVDLQDDNYERDHTICREDEAYAAGRLAGFEDALSATGREPEAD
jgi:hypothetical protein